MDMTVSALAATSTVLLTIGIDRAYETGRHRMTSAKIPPAKVARAIERVRHHLARAGFQMNRVVQTASPISVVEATAT
jgi:hypothetical protein